MSDCPPYNACNDIDGRLLITRTIDGPNLSLNEDIALGEFQLEGAGLRPYVRLGFLQQWVVKEMCIGPVRSVLGLAPGEKVTTDVRTVDSYEFTSLVQQAMESSEVSTNTRLEGREFVDTNWDGNTVDLSKITVGEWGSLWEVIGAVAGAVVGGPIGAGVGAWVGGAIDDATSDGGGGGGPAPNSATGKVVSVIEESLETIQKSQSSHLLTERSSSVSRTRERSTTRSFENPYFNRSLELRFSPVFRHFEVITTLFKFEWGLSLDIGKVQFPKYGMGQTHGDFLAARLTDQRLLSVANAELGIDDEFSTSARNGVIGSHLNANSEQYSKKLLRHMHSKRDLNTLQTPVAQALRSKVRSNLQAEELGKAFQWSSTYTKDNSIFVPATTADLALKKLELKSSEKEAFAKKLKRIAVPELKIVVSKKDIHLFAGTQIEAVAGNCVLPDVPVTRPVPTCCCSTQAELASEEA